MILRTQLSLGVRNTASTSSFGYATLLIEYLRVPKYIPIIWRGLSTAYPCRWSYGGQIWAKRSSNLRLWIMTSYLTLNPPLTRRVLSRHLDLVGPCQIKHQVGQRAIGKSCTMELVLACLTKPESSIWCGRFRI